MLLKEEAVMYVEGLFKNSPNVITGTSQDVQHFSRMTGLPVQKILTAQFEAPFKTKHPLHIMQLFFPDGTRGTSLDYSGELKLRYFIKDTADIAFFDEDDEDWQTDLGVLYYMFCNKK